MASLCSHQKEKTLQYLLKLETCALSLGVWWNEAVEGGRPWITTHHKINFFREHCSSMVTDTTVIADKVLYCMASATTVEPAYPNGYTSHMAGFDASFWVAGGPTGGPYENPERGRMTYVDPKSRRLRDVLHQSPRDEIWRATQMKVKLTKEYLVTVPGPANFVIQRKLLEEEGQSIDKKILVDRLR